jgi:hypothetical protein
MAQYINGLINIVNTLSCNIDKNNNMLQQLALKVSQIEGEKNNSQTPIVVDNNEGALVDIRNTVSQLEKSLRDTICKERMIIENTVMAKAEELVKRIVSEKVSSETQLIASEMKMMINELRDQDSDTMSLAQTEIRSLTHKKKGGKKTYDL